MTDSQRKAAIATATETILKLLETAPEYGDIGITLTLHGGEVRRVVESCARTVKGVA